MKIRATLLPSLVSCALFVACAGTESPAAGVMLRLRTDMAFPEAVQRVGLYIARVEGDKTQVILREEVATAKEPDGKTTVSLPTELAIESNREANVYLRIRSVAYGSDDVVLAMREARLQVPNDKLVSLPLALLWMNGDDVEKQKRLVTETGALQGTGNGIDAFAELTSTVCGNDETLDDTGACSSIDVDVTQLDGITSGDRGAQADSESTCGCFDLNECFAKALQEESDPNFRAMSGPIQWLDQTNGICGLELGDPGQIALAAGSTRVGELATGLAVGVRATEREGATCIDGTQDCFIVLDTKSGVDVRPREDAPGLWAVLPPGVCRKWDRKRLGERPVVAFPSCTRKAPDQRVCAAGETGCRRTDSGWNGQGRTPEAGVIEEAATCGVLAGAGGLWANDERVIVTSRSGSAPWFPGSMMSAAGCLSETIPNDYDGPERTTYRVLPTAAGQALFGLMGSDGTAGVLTEPKPPGQLYSNAPKVGIGMDLGSWAAGPMLHTDSFTLNDLLFLSTLGEYKNLLPGDRDDQHGTIDPAVSLAFLSNGVLAGNSTRFVGSSPRAADAAITMLYRIDCVRTTTTLVCTPSAEATGLVDEPVSLVQDASNRLYLLGRTGEVHAPVVVELNPEGTPNVRRQIPLTPTHAIDSQAQLVLGSTALLVATNGPERAFIERVDRDVTRAKSIVTREKSLIQGVAYAASADSLTARAGWLYWSEWPIEDGIANPDRAQVRRVALNANDEPLP